MFKFDMRTSSGLLNSTGGLVYHVRALRFNRGIWQPFRDHLDQWYRQLDQRLQFLESNEFYIIGPSGGYFFPIDWWKSLNTRKDKTRWVLVDPDPVALWKMRSLWNKALIPSARMRHQLVLVNAPLSVDVIDKYFKCERSSQVAWLQTSVLFCNLVGQLKNAEPHTQRQWHLAIQKLTPLLEQAKWASYHDRYSFELSAKNLVKGRRKIIELGTLSLGRKITPQDWIQFLSPALQSQGQTIEWMDHEPEVFLPQILTKRDDWGAVWEIMPGVFHLIHGVF